MTRVSVFAGSMLAMVLLLSLVISGPLRGTASSQDDNPVFAAYVPFVDGQLRPDRAAVRAFVETGSLSTNCLVTLAESTNPVPGTTVFCGPRVFEGRNGVLVGIFFPQPMPAPFFTSVTIYQEHARGYGAPVFYPGT
jgi:hypothetical protein